MENPMKKEKILLCIAGRDNRILKIDAALKRLDYEVVIVSLDTYEMNCSYFAKKMLKLGFKRYEKDYLKKWTQNLFKVVESENISCIFSLNLPDELLALDDMRRLRDLCNGKGIKLVVWIVDPLKNNMQYWQYCEYFDVVYTYEKYDEKCLLERGVNAKYCPVGYQEEYQASNHGEQDIDIFFIGTPYKSRLAVLNKLAMQAKEKKWKLVLAGPFYKNFVKRMIFRLRYPAMYPYVINKTMDASEIASYYCRSKICLNIHGNGALGLNPRSFDILAAGAFQLVDERDNYDIFQDGQELISYKDADALVEKVTYYLEHQKERCQIAEQGRLRAVPRRSMTSCMAYMTGKQE